MSKATCFICEETTDSVPVPDRWVIAGMHVCPTCRRRCEIGKRVEGMALAENGFGIGGVSYAAGRNEALREAKGEK